MLLLAACVKGRVYRNLGQREVHDILQVTAALQNKINIIDPSRTGTSIHFKTILEGKATRRLHRKSLSEKYKKNSCWMLGVTFLCLANGWTLPRTGF
jgi:hypothetical protein